MAAVEEEVRPLPEDLLAIARRSEEGRGRLTVYLGYAAGVGKTYTMLEDALQRRGEGVDIVIGYVETHGRPETGALAARLEAVPPATIDYQGLTLREMNLDAVLERHPEVALVDELAHTNAPGSRHVKRYEDVEELLHAGISVYTTVNIQHVESQSDAVAQITGVRVLETVPDTFLSGADEIRLVDVTPEELRLRLRAGKVYVRDMAEAAIGRFFSTGNLLALRQLALRYVATATDRQMVGHMRARAIPGPWPAAERLLVGIRPGPTAGQLVRAGYRLAVRLDADWVVLTVDLESERALTLRERAWLTAALETGRRLGGRIVRLRGEDVADEILRYARRNNVTMIMLGKPRGVDSLFSPVYRVLRRSRGIDIVLYEPKEDVVRIPILRQVPHLLSWDYAASLVLIAAAWGASILLQGIAQPELLLVLQLLPVVVTALFFRRGAALLAAVVSILAFDLIFVKPYYSLTVDDWGYFAAFAGYVVIALVVSRLASRLRRLLPQMRESEAEVEAVAGLSRDLARAATREEAFDTLARHMQGFGPGSSAVLAPGPAGLHVLAGDPGYPLDAKERSIARWSYENGEAAGRGTDNLPSGTGHYIPVRVHRLTFGVMAFVFADPEEVLTPENKEIFQTMALLAALTLERMN
jgi:two-component system sensor histidine kinase KdpD